MDMKKKLKIASNITFYTGVAMAIYYFYRFFSVDACLLRGSDTAIFFTIFVIVTALLLISSVVLLSLAQASAKKEIEKENE